MGRADRRGQMAASAFGRTPRRSHGQVMGSGGVFWCSVARRTSYFSVVGVNGRAQGPIGHISRGRLLAGLQAMVSVTGEVFRAAHRAHRMTGVSDAFAVIEAHGAETEMRGTHLLRDGEHDD